VSVLLVSLPEALEVHLDFSIHLTYIKDPDTQTYILQGCFCFSTRLSRGKPVLLPVLETRGVNMTRSDAGYWKVGGGEVLPVPCSEALEVLLGCCTFISYMKGSCGQSSTTTTLQKLYAVLYTPKRPLPFLPTHE
jgi:hypothetical protein